MHPFRPVDHCQRRPHRTVGIEDLQTQSLRPQVPLHTRQRGGRLASQKCAIAEIAGQRRAGEIVRGSVAKIDDDVRVEHAQIAKQAIRGRIRSNCRLDGIYRR